MKPNRVNRWIGIAANVGVLIGILILVYELRQNHELARAQTRIELANTTFQLNLSIATDEQLAEIIRKSFAGEELTDTEYIRQLNFNVANLSYWESLNLLASAGLYDQAAYERRIAGFRTLIRNNRYARQSYCLNRYVLSAEFTTSVDEMLDGMECE